MFQRSCVEVEKLPQARSIVDTKELTMEHTLIVPSSVLATTVLSKASLASPVIHRSSFFLFPVGRKRLATLGGQGPMSNVRRRMPDCMLYMLMTPVEEAVRPKLPHADTHTACAGLSKRRLYTNIGSDAYLDRAYGGAFLLLLSDVENVLARTFVLHGPCSRYGFIGMCCKDVIPIFCPGRRM